MLVAFELSGEHPELPAAEALASLRALGIPHERMLHTDGLLVVEVDAPPAVLRTLASRLALSRCVLLVLSMSMGPESTFFSMLRELDGEDIGESFCVRARGIGGVRINSEHVERTVGAIVRQHTGRRVSLSHPDTVLRALVGRAVRVLGRVVSHTARRMLLGERPHERPFFHPGVMLPVLARAVVNLTETREGGRLLDPFCGTGGLLIEAARVGCVSVGGDAQARMVRGARMNLRSLGLDAQLLELDATCLPFSDGTMDGAACDPPYGRSARRMGSSDEALYGGSLMELARVLRGDARAVVVYAQNLYKGEPIPEMAQRAGFDVERCFVMRVHRSLTRCILVLHRK